MSRKSPIPQTRRHILVFDEDWELLRQLYGSDSDSRLGAGAAVRQIVHAKCQQLRTALAAQRDARQGQNADDANAALETP